MPLDRQARADQIGRILAAHGELLTYEGLSEPFSATIKPVPPAFTDAYRNIKITSTSVLVTAARAVFGAKLPRQGQHFTDADGNLLRIQGLPPSVPTLPTIEFICGSVVAQP